MYRHGPQGALRLDASACPAVFDHRHKMHARGSIELHIIRAHGRDFIEPSTAEQGHEWEPISGFSFAAQRSLSPKIDW